MNEFGEVLENVDLTKYNSYGIKSGCKYLVYPNNVDDLVKLIEYLNNEGINYKIFGSLSNVILPSSVFNGAIIKLDKLDNVEVYDNYVISEAGVLLSELVNILMAKNKGGFELLGTIPGTLGGAIYGNAGVKEYAILDFIEYIEVIRNNELIKLDKDVVKYSYRSTIFKNNTDIIVRVKLRIEDKDSKLMREVLSELRTKRRETQPLEYKNAGSVFKNLTGYYAGELIDKCGLKGYNVGGAYVSNKHANFIINKDNASSEDILSLIEVIKSRVKEEFNVDLELEQIVVKW